MSRFDGMGDVNEIAKKHGDTFEGGKVERLAADMNVINHALADKEAGEELIKAVEDYDAGPDEQKHKHEIEQLITALTSGSDSPGILLMLPGVMEFIVSCIVISWRVGCYSAVKDRR